MSSGEKINKNKNNLSQFYIKEKKMKKYSIFLIAILVLVETSSAQKLKKYTYKCTFEVGSSKLSDHDKLQVRQLKNILDQNSDYEAFFYASADTTGWTHTKSRNLEIATDGGLIVTRVRSAAIAMGLKEVEHFGVDTDLNSRHVRVELRPGMKALANAVLLGMKKDREQDANIKANSKKLAVHDKKIQDIENRLLEKGSNFYHLEVGNGLVAVKYSDIKWKAMPSLRLIWNLAPKFGLQAEGGTVPVGNFNNEPTWDGVLHTAAFWRPLSFVKILAGYSLSANFYESDFAIAESRDDAFLIGAELNAQMSEKVKIYISGSWVKSKVDGFSVSVGVSYSFWK